MQSSPPPEGSAQTKEAVRIRTHSPVHHDGESPFVPEQSAMRKKSETAEAVLPSPYPLPVGTGAFFAGS
jgi:hypothetical protein